MDKLTAFFNAFYRSGYFTVLSAVLITAGAVLLLRLIYVRVCHAIIPRLRYSREFSYDGVYEGGDVDLIETIYNPTPFPLIFVDVEGYIYNDLRLKNATFDSKKGMQFFKSRFSLLLPYMRIKRTHTVSCIKRGVYKLESIQLFLARSDRYVECPAQIYVYPALLDSPAIAEPMSLKQGELESRRWLMRDPFSVSGIRDYVYGDPFNHINFKATAKTFGFSASPFKVNESDFSASRNLMVMINYSTDPNEPIPVKTYNKMQETALGRAAELIRQAIASGFCAGFRANCLTMDSQSKIVFPTGGSEEHLKDILRSMASVRNAPGVSFTALLDDLIFAGTTDTEFYIFTPTADDETEARINDLRYSSNSVQVIVGDREDDDEQ